MERQGNVQYPRKRKPVSPLKLATCAKLEELKDAGLNLTGLCHTHKTVFLCVKHELPYVDQIVQSLRNGSWKERELWRLFFLEGHSAVSEIQKAYAHYEETIPLAAPSIRRPDQDIKYLYWHHKWRIDAVKQHLPEGVNHSVQVLHAAASLHIQLHSNARLVNNIFSSPVTIDRHNIGNVVFIADHLDEIMKRKNSFMELGMWSETQIRPVLEAGNVALAAGVL